MWYGGVVTEWRVGYERVGTRWRVLEEGGIYRVEGGRGGGSVGYGR